MNKSVLNKSSLHKSSYATFLLLAAIGCPRLWAADAVLTADAYVSTAAVNTNYGTQATLNVGGGDTAFLQFDLSTLPPGSTAASIAGAQLIFFVDRVGVGGSVDLHAVAAPWTETTPISGSSSINPTGFATVPTTAAGDFAAVDVTSLVQNWIAGTTPNYGIAITAAATELSTQVYIDSKENTTTSHPARLQINLIGPVGATGPAGATGPTGAQGATGSAGAAGTSPYVFQAASNFVEISCALSIGCNINQTIQVICPTNFLRFSPVNAVTPLPTITGFIVTPPFSNTEFDFVYTGTLNDGQITTIGGNILCVSGVPIV
jgi:hypothetical protein